jgi:hypothetical protein
MDRTRLIAIAIGIAVVAFFAGFLSQWTRANRMADDLAETRFQLHASQTEGKIAAALTESLRSNYERSRQLMAEVYAELEAMEPRVDERQRAEIRAILARRDEIITLLARAAPESSQRLMMIHTRYRAAMLGLPLPAGEAGTPGN